MASLDCPLLANQVSTIWNLLSFNSTQYRFAHYYSAFNIISMCVHFTNRVQVSMNKSEAVFIISFYSFSSSVLLTNMFLSGHFYITFLIVESYL